MKHAFGWRPDLSDLRDHVLSIPRAVSLPASADLRTKMPAVYDQGELGSCTANAIAAALEYDAIKQGEAVVAPSRLFIYYNERVIENSVSSDAGAAIRDGIKSVNSVGVCPEGIWPYIEAKFAKKPTATAYADAKKFKSVSYATVGHTAGLTALRTSLAQGLPIVFGFTAYEALESDAVANTGVLPMPVRGDQPIGGHAVLCVGYDDAKKQVLVRNSWGSNWGLGGYFWMPYDYLTKSSLASDFWVVKTVS